MVTPSNQELENRKWKIEIRNSKLENRSWKSKTESLRV